MTDHPIPPALRGTVRTGLVATGACLGMGLTMSAFVTGPAAPVAGAFVWLGLLMLVSLPVLTVLGVLIDEWRRKEWVFVAAAIGALVLLAYAVARKSGDLF